MTRQFFNSQIVGGTYVQEGIGGNTDGFPNGSSYTPCCTSETNIYDWEKQVGLISYEGTNIAGIKDSNFTAMFLTEYDYPEEYCSSCDDSGYADNNLHIYYDPRNFTYSLYSHDAFNFRASIKYTFEQVNVVDFEFISNAIFGMIKHRIYSFSASCTFPTSTEDELTDVDYSTTDMTLSSPGVTFKRCKRNYKVPIDGEITIEFIGCYHSKIRFYRGIGIDNYFNCINVGGYIPQVIEFRFSTGDLCMNIGEHITPVLFTASRYTVDTAVFIIHKYQFNDNYPNDISHMIPVRYAVITDNNYDPDLNNPQYNPYSYTTLPDLEFGTYTIELYMENAIGSTESIFFGYVDTIEEATKFQISPEIQGELDVLTTSMRMRDPYTADFVDSDGWDVTLQSALYSISGGVVGNHFATFSIGDTHYIYTGFDEDNPSESILAFDYKTLGPAGLIIPGSYTGTFTMVEKCNTTEDYTTTLDVSLPFPDDNITYITQDLPLGVTRVIFNIPAYTDAITYCHTSDYSKYYHVHYTESFDLEFGNGTSIMGMDVTIDDQVAYNYPTAVCIYEAGNYFATYIAYNSDEKIQNILEINIGWDTLDSEGYWLLSYATTHNTKLELDDDTHHRVATFSVELPDGTSYANQISIPIDTTKYWTEPEYLSDEVFATLEYYNPIYYVKNESKFPTWEVVTDSVYPTTVCNGPIYPLSEFTVFGTNLINVNEGFLFPTFASLNNPQTDVKSSDLFPTMTYAIDLDVYPISDTEVRCVLREAMPTMWVPYSTVYADDWLSTTGSNYYVHLADTSNRSVNHVMEVQVTDTMPYITGCYFPTHYIRRGENVDSGGDIIWVMGRFNNVTALVYDIDGSPLITGSPTFPNYVEGLGSVDAGTIMQINIITTADTPIGLITIEVQNEFGSYSTVNLVNRTTIPIVYYNPVITSIIPSSIENGRIRYLHYSESGFSNEVTIWGTDLYAPMAVSSNVTGLLFEYPTKTQPSDGSHLYFDLTVANVQNWNELNTETPVNLRGIYTGVVTGDYSSAPVLSLTPPNKVDITDIGVSVPVHSDNITYNGSYNALVNIDLIGTGFLLKETIDNIEHYITVSNVYGIYTDELPYDPEEHLSVSSGVVSFDIWIDPTIQQCNPIGFTVTNPDGAYTTYSYETGKHRFMTGFLPASLLSFSITSVGGPFELATGELIGTNIAAFESIACMRGGLDSIRGDLWRNLPVISGVVSHGEKGDIFGSIIVTFVMGNVGYRSIRTSHCGVTDSLDF
ncbi:MAG: hypothetical protein WC877_00175 [Dehalococcoidales bacterium]